MAAEDRSRLMPGSGLRNFAHGHGSLSSRWGRNRSNVNLAEHAAPPPPAKSALQASKSTPKIERTPSKMSLFNLFSKPKVEKARGHTEVGLAVPMRPQTPPKPTQQSPPKSSLRHNPSPQAQQTIRARSSQILRPMSMRPTSTTPPTIPANQDHGNWTPPPLFQAYPQAIKYATLQACAFSPDILLRTQSQRRQAELVRERIDSAMHEKTSETRKLEKNHRRLMSNSTVGAPTPHLTNKVYVLITSGYILQYSGDGPFDRLPEKVLKLGKESAAFACDLIPGKHWVLQISQCAHDDGTVAMGPKTSLLSRLRLQNSTVRKAAASFLLVLESAGEMDSWMTTVRREIDRVGGARQKDGSIRESTSIDEPFEKQSTELPQTHRYRVHRDPNRLSKSTPVDSPLQSQYSGSPRIVTSDWEGRRSERTVSITDSSSLHSTRQDNRRQSAEVSSIATTVVSHVSHDQLQLDQLRERSSRFSYMSVTSASGAGTRDTSRNPSPAPHSPMKESFSPASTAEPEPLRSATSLRSFHMNPTNGTAANRRRSMQPLPVTNEDCALPAAVQVTPQRHSIYGPTSPTAREAEKLDLPVPVAKEPTPSAPIPVPVATVTVTDAAAPTRPPRFSSHMQPLTLSHNQTQDQYQSRTVTEPRSKFSTRSSSAPPPRNSTISPPPRDPAPAPPAQARPLSTIGNLPTVSTSSSLESSSSDRSSPERPTPPERVSRRISSTPKPFLRPFPVRPQAQHTNASFVAPRRLSSLNQVPAPIPLTINVNRSVTAPIRTSANSMPQSASMQNLQTATPPSQQLRRPTSVQVRSADPAPFLSSRPVRAISSTPSFVPGRRASSTPPAPLALSATAQLQPSPSFTTLKEHAQAQQRFVAPRRSMPVIGLPPPAPPPNMPLPPPPPVSAPRVVLV